MGLVLQTGSGQRLADLGLAAALAGQRQQVVGIFQRAQMLVERNVFR